jgi:hypothetical protein
MSFRFPIDFVFVVLGSCESRRRLRKLTVQFEKAFSPFFCFVLFCFVLFLSLLSSDGQSKRGDRSRLWSRKVKETSMMAETDLERRVLKLKLFYIL